jgi:hypothetical protein
VTTSPKTREGPHGAARSPAPIKIHEPIEVSVDGTSSPDPAAPVGSAGTLPPGKISYGFGRTARDLDRALGIVLGPKGVVLQQARERSYRPQGKAVKDSQPLRFRFNLSALARVTGYDRKTLRTAVAELVHAKVLVQHKGGWFTINKDYRTWTLRKAKRKTRCGLSDKSIRWCQEVIRKPGANRKSSSDAAGPGAGRIAPTQAERDRGGSHPGGAANRTDGWGGSHSVETGADRTQSDPLQQENPAHARVGRACGESYGVRYDSESDRIEEEREAGMIPDRPGLSAQQWAQVEQDVTNAMRDCWGGRDIAWAVLEARRSSNPLAFAEVIEGAAAEARHFHVHSHRKFIMSRWYAFEQGEWVPPCLEPAQSTAPEAQADSESLRRYPRAQFAAKEPPPTFNREAFRRLQNG